MIDEKKAAQNIVLCGECEFWDNSESFIKTSCCPKDFGKCKNDKFRYTEEPPPNETDSLVFMDTDWWDAYFFTGKDFGCIHGVKK